ncbi:MAG: hypothetical protein FWC72_03015 [Oscillospiraceae bacterium]|nr:hypothetical protein [Oscillospiraceae bacterium]
MNDKWVACFTNPIKCKLLSDIQAQGQTTAKQLAERNPGIPQATLYRYLKRMVEDGVLAVLEERQVRNVREKVYGMAIDFEAEIENIVEGNSGVGYLGLFQQFSNGLLHEFQTYAAKDGIDIKHDGSGFRISPFYATFDELAELSRNIQALIKPYSEQEPTPERRMRNVAIVFTPPTEL